MLNWKGYTFDEITETNEYLIYNDDPTELSTNETFFETFQRVEELYNNNNHTLFVTHQDTIRSFMFYSLINLTKINRAIVNYNILKIILFKNILTPSR